MKLKSKIFVIGAALFLGVFATLAAVNSSQAWTGDNAGTHMAQSMVQDQQSYGWRHGGHGSGHGRGGCGW